MSTFHADADFYNTDDKYTEAPVDAADVGGARRGGHGRALPARAKFAFIVLFAPALFTLLQLSKLSVAIAAMLLFPCRGLGAVAEPSAEMVGIATFGVAGEAESCAAGDGVATGVCFVLALRLACAEAVAWSAGGGGNPAGA